MNRHVSILASLVVHLAILLLLVTLTWVASSTGAVTLVFQTESTAETDPVVMLEIDETEGTGDEGEFEIASTTMQVTEVSLPENHHRIGHGGQGTGTLGGIPVYGSVTLVCDVSGSMRGDLPELLKELSRKFPGSTVILVEGCRLDGWDQSHQDSNRHWYSLQELQIKEYRELGLDLHFKSGGQPSSGLFDAADQPSAGVIFNCDLQDGISREFATKLTDYYLKRGKTLSCRSLGCDSPSEFTALLERTGGKFRLDVIDRKPSPALPLREGYEEWKRRRSLVSDEERKRVAEQARVATEQNKQRKRAKEAAIRRMRTQRARARRNR